MEKRIKGLKAMEACGWAVFAILVAVAIGVIIAVPLLVSNLL
jgi:hypothetical protein